MQGLCLQEMNKPEEALKLCEVSWRQAVSDGEHLNRRTYQIVLNLFSVYSKQGIVNAEAEHLYRFIAKYTYEILHDEEKAAQFEKLAKEVRRNLRS